MARVRTNQTARRSTLPVYEGPGRRPKRGELVRPLARSRAGQNIEAAPPDETVSWGDGKHHLRAEIWKALVLPQAQTFRIVAIHDPRHKQPLLLADNLSVSVQALWRLYRDRWAIEQLPLPAKPMKALLGSGGRAGLRLRAREPLPPAGVVLAGGQPALLCRCLMSWAK